MTDELKPCPFCSGPATIQRQEYRGTGSSGMETPYPFVECNGCGVKTVPVRCDSTPYGKRKGDKSYRQAEHEAITTWNTRAPDPRIAELEAEVVAAYNVAIEDASLAGFTRACGGGKPRDVFDAIRALAKP